MQGSERAPELCQRTHPQIIWVEDGYSCKQFKLVCPAVRSEVPLGTYPQPRIRSATSAEVAVPMLHDWQWL